MIQYYNFFYGELWWSAADVTMLLVNATAVGLCRSSWAVWRISSIGGSGGWRPGRNPPKRTRAYKKKKKKKKKKNGERRNNYMSPTESLSALHPLPNWRPHQRHLLDPPLSIYIYIYIYIYNIYIYIYIFRLKYIHTSKRMGKFYWYILVITYSDNKQLHIIIHIPIRKKSFSNTYTKYIPCSCYQHHFDTVMYETSFECLCSQFSIVNWLDPARTSSFYKTGNRIRLNFLFWSLLDIAR